MDPLDIATKTGATVNTVLDTLKQEWLLNLLLWILLIGELSAILTGRSLQVISSEVLVRDLGWNLLEPVINGSAQTLRALLGYEWIWISALLMLVILASGVLVSFGKDGARLPHMTIEELAPLNLMLRFTILVTFSAFTGTVVALLAVLVCAALVYAFGAASGSNAGQRSVGFVFGLATICILGALTLLGPFVLATRTLWQASVQPLR
ncbi:hypothetical protein [Leucobacter celer]|uniref:hypothetical protein n=1 Tax=Leucobacter celer TaxID=668625 RepID=UPI000A98B336|nr:hypothetical protein [Leucobacter celer]